MAKALEKIAEDIKAEIEKLKDEVQREEAEEDEQINEARTGNNEVSSNTFGQWKGQVQAKREEVNKLEKKWEYLKKTIEDEERKEAEKVVLEGGSDGLDEEEDAERKEEK